MSNANEAPAVHGFQTREPILSGGPQGAFAVARDGGQVVWADPQGAFVPWL